MKKIILIFITLFVSTTHAETAKFSRYTKELPKRLEVDAAAVMIRSLTYNFAKEICMRHEGDLSEEVNSVATNWVSRNDKYIRAATLVFNDYGNRYLQNSGIRKKESYLLHITKKNNSYANKKVMRQLSGASLRNSIIPPQNACEGLIRVLSSERRDFVNTPKTTQFLLPYMKKNKIK